MSYDARPFLIPRSTTTLAPLFPWVRVLLTVVFFGLGAPSLLAQDEWLQPDPDAVQLEPVWMKVGSYDFQEYGAHGWGGEDLDSDGIADFGVYQDDGYSWLLYQGGEPIDTAATWRYEFSSSLSLAFGNFYGDNRRYMYLPTGYVDTVSKPGYQFYYSVLRLFRLTPDGPSTDPEIAVDYGTQDPPLERFTQSVHVADVTNDGVDDLIIATMGHHYGKDPAGGEPVPRIWIYPGGPDFQLDSASIIITDSLLLDGGGSEWEAHIGNFDGDEFPDLMLQNIYPDSGAMMRFYWGDERGAAGWAERPPDRDVLIGNQRSGLSGDYFDHLYNLDGDGVYDFVSTYRVGTSSNRVPIYLSSKGSARTRSFSHEDVDKRIAVNKLASAARSPGPLNDSSGRFDMLRVGVTTGRTDLLSGSSGGVDVSTEAWLTQDPSTRSLHDNAVGDVTGDGWADFLTHNPSFGFVSRGIAMLFAGGPHIPHDDPTVSVQVVPVAGEPQAISVYPNPVTDALHIAWRGDLPHEIAAIQVVDMAGRAVAEFQVIHNLGSALWNCPRLSAGSYRLVFLDSSGSVIASVHIMKL